MKTWPLSPKTHLFCNGGEAMSEGGRRSLRTPVERSAKIAFAVGITTCIGMLAVAAVLYSQTLTAPTTTAAVLARNCEPAAANPASGIPVGTSGFVIWRCTLTTAALTVNTGGGTVTPTFTLGTGFTSLYVYPAATGPVTDCLSATGEKPLSSGTSVAFAGGDAGGWNYCSDFTTAPAIFGQTVVTWSQP